ncbi:MAG: PIN domain-containing protein [Hydrotalea sp.]|jgi:predicted nucleic acid-binding protein|nr:PIN domain-containing protein [Hydrotalea sp.]
MERVFVDTDILMDLLSARQPHYEAAANLFSLADEGKIKIYVSSLAFSNLFYILSRHLDTNQARKKIIQFKTLVSVLSVGDKVIDLALSSDFRDFEDAIQYFTAIENRLEILLTRNLHDYKKANILVMTAEQFLLSSS